MENPIQIDPQVRGGEPCLKNTRFPIARIYAELADNESLSEIAEEYALNYDHLKELLQFTALTMVKNM
jgi:uncharacterized protein (DUF433 family)